MPVAAGVFTPSQLAQIVVAQSSVFRRSPNLYTPKTEVLREIVKMQTADVSPVAGSAYNKVKVAWQNSQAILAANCAPNCVIDGVQTGTDAVEMTLTGCVQTTFKKEVPVGNDPLSAYAGGSITYAQSLAADMMQAKRVIQEEISARMLAKLATFSGVNADNSGQYGSVVGQGTGTGLNGIPTTQTNVPAANWNEGIFPYFQLEAELNRMALPYLLDSATSGLYLRRLNAIPNSLNDTQRDQLAKYQMIEAVFDNFSFAKAGIANTAFVVDGTAVAFAARNIYSASVEQVEANTAVFSVPGAPTEAQDGTLSAASLFNIDVTVQRTCQVVLGVKKWFDAFEMKVPFFDLIADPYRLGGGTNSGVLKFVKV